jgi:hypothetical protein
VDCALALPLVTSARPARRVTGFSGFRVPAVVADLAGDGFADVAVVDVVTHIHPEIGRPWREDTPHVFAGRPGGPAANRGQADVIIEFGDVQPGMAVAVAGDLAGNGRMELAAVFPGWLDGGEVRI